MKHANFNTYQLYYPHKKFIDKYGIMLEGIPIGDMIPCNEFIKARTLKEAESKMIRRLHSRDIRLGVFEMRLIEGGDE